MITVKEFEEQKQDLAIKLNDALDAMLELKPNLASNIVADQIKAIHKLQPPRPTCDSCKYLLDDKIHDYECNAWGKSGQAISDMAGNYLSDPDDNNRIDFGCIHHSDYDEVKND